MPYIVRLSALILCLFSLHVTGQVRLPRLISDGVVLQRDKPLNVWGWAQPGEKITLTLSGKSYESVTESSGKWKIALPAQKAGGPHEIIIKGTNEVKVSDVLFGDVWICSGQSNMELMMDRLRDTYPKEIAASENKFIRHFTVPDAYDFHRVHDDLDGGVWESASPATILRFSGVGYFFAREIYGKHKVPVGLINASLGGSPVESWCSEDVLKNFPKPYEELQKFRDDAFVQKREADHAVVTRDWFRLLNANDPGLRGPNRFFEEKYSDDDWKTIEMPSDFPSFRDGFPAGSVWLRKVVELPASFAGKQSSLWLGRIVDSDSVCVNGKFTGTTGYQYPPRKYTVPSGVLREGKNLIAAKVIVQNGPGGFVKDKPYFIASGADTIDLTGTWKFTRGAAMQPLPGLFPTRWKPAGLYNRMIAPLTHLPVRGVLFYQGESNAGAPEGYAKTFGDMINGWRRDWNQPDMPFFFVQLANFMEERNEPVESSWARLRQEQLNTLKVPNTGMAVTIDLGEWNDIHPLNKHDVGRRLALLARKNVYGEKNLVATGPLPAGATFNKNQVEIRFEKSSAALKTKGHGNLAGFSISEDGKTFRWADARISGNTVIVTAPGASDIRVVRYAWADNPAKANLINSQGLPATPFEFVRDAEK